MTADRSGHAEAWAHRGFLLNVAYRLLGNFSDAEDVVQEGFSRLLRADQGPIVNVRSWLVVVVTRLCLDQLRSARARRESYVGPSFPEPIVTSAEGTADPADLLVLDESVRFALLVVLDRMTPAERVVFVLHEAFQFPFEDIASIVARSPAACRQLATRARRRIETTPASPRVPRDARTDERVIDEFMAACSTGNVRALLPLLDPAVVGWADVGGLLPAIAPTVGALAVAETAMRFFRPGTGRTLARHTINGEPGVVAFRHGTVFAVFVLTVRDGLITALYGQADPRKLARVRRALAPGSREA